jgi:hypothetical protein
LLKNPNGCEHKFEDEIDCIHYNERLLSLPM